MKKLTHSLRWALSLLGCCLPLLAGAQSSDNFTWDNASVYFVITDRFLDGNSANNNSYGRGLNGFGQPYTDPDMNTANFHGGDLKGLTQKISEGYFDDLGVNALWISAVYEQAHGWVGGGSTGAFPHYGYHGYYALDFTEMDANFGTEADMQAFVDSAHAHGIRVVMDVVMNHSAYATLHDMAEFGFGTTKSGTDWRGWQPSGGETWHDFNANFMDYAGNWNSWWGADWMRHPDITSYDGCSPGGGLTNCVGFLPDFKTESTQEVGIPTFLVNKWTAEGTLAQKQAELNAWFVGKPRTPSNYLIFWLKEWVRKYGIDGFRVDTAKHVELLLWKKLKEESNIALNQWRAANPSKALDDQDFWTVAEVWGHGPNKSEYHTVADFNSVINFNLQNDARVAGSTSDLEAMFSGYAANVNSDPSFNILSYLSSHDTQLYPRASLRNAAIGFMLMPGGVQIFYGDEVARPLGTTVDAEHNTRSSMQWNNLNASVWGLWSKLGSFRRDHPSIGGGTHQKISDSPYTFVREYENSALGIYDKVAVVVGASGATTINVAGKFENGTALRSASTGQVSTVANGTVTFNADSDGLILIEYETPPAYVPRPTVTVSPGSTYDPASVTVTISAADVSDNNPTIYWATSALPTSNPGAWNVYSGPITVTSTTDIYAFAINSGGGVSDVVSQRYTIGAIEPFTVYFKKPSNWANARIYYWNVDPAGTMPTVAWPGVAMTALNNGWYEFQINALSASIIFNNAGQPQTADLFRDRDGWYMDGQWYDQCPGTCPTPVVPVTTINTAGGTFDPGTNVSVSISATQGGTIYYTTNGSTPSNTNGTLYGGPFTLTGTEGQTFTVKAIAYNGVGASTVVQATYQFQTIPRLTIYFKNNAGWANPYIYFWQVVGGSPVPGTTWPGVAMTALDSGWYSYTIMGDTCSNVIFSNQGTPQTADLYACGDSWYSNGVWYDQCPGQCPPSPEEPEEPTGPNPAPTNYCASAGTLVGEDWIKRVQVLRGTTALLDNFSGRDAGYGNFTDSVAAPALTAGSAYKVAIYPGRKDTGLTRLEGYKVWIDWNRDGDFRDEGELVYSRNLTDLGSVRGDFTVPAGASIGLTRMRVQMKYGQIPFGSCETFSRGEVEDYLLNIVPSAARQSASASKRIAETAPAGLSVFPNPASGTVRLALTGEGSATASLYDPTGREVRQLQLSAGTVEQVSLQGLPRGLYLIKATDGAGQVHTARLVVQ